MKGEVKRCKRDNCSRATFVETDEGVSADFRHGSDTHREVYSIEQMKIYLASRGFVVVEASKILRAA
jgi:hypothetical protein